MRLFRKLLVVLAVMLVIAALALAVVFVYLPETDLIRDGLREKLSTLTGHEVTVGSLKVAFAFPTLIHIKLRDIAVASPEGKPLLVTESAELTPSLISLLSGRVDVESVTFNGLQAFVRRAPAPPESAPSTPLEPVPADDRSVTRPSEEKAPEVRTTQPPRPEVPAGPKPAGPVKWSVTSVHLVNSRVEWIDAKTVEGTELRLEAKDLNGSLTRNKSGKGFTFSLNGKITDSSGQGSPLALDGTLHPNNDMSGLTSALVNCRAEGLEVKPFVPYLPPKARFLAQFDRAGIRGRVNWKQNQTAAITLNAQLKTEVPEPAQLSLQGDVVADRLFSAVDSAEISAETDLLPLKFVKDFVPASAPLNREVGHIKASVKGVWKSDRTWNAKGSVGLENALLTGALRALGKQAGIWVHFELDPERLNLESLELSQPEKFASLHGTIAHPFSDGRQIDLGGTVDFQPRWLAAAGIKLPHGVRLGGVIPVTGRVRTQANAFKVELEGDLVPAHLTWAPHVEKKSGTKGHLSFNGTIVPGKKPVGVGSQGKLRVGLDGVAVHLKPGARALAGMTVQWSSRFSVTAKGVDLPAAVAVVKPGPAAPDIMRAEANITGLGSAAGKIEGSARLALDDELLAATGFKPQGGLTLTGHALLTAKFVGSPTALRWETECPLNKLAVTVENVFKKPQGVSGEVKATGKWGEQGLFLSSGRVSLPGVVVTGQGNLLDRNGAFHDLTLNLKKADVKALAAFIPPLVEKGLSGPMDATVRLSGSDKGITHSGEIRPAGLVYRQPKAEWWLDAVKGTVTVKGEKVEFPKITGRIHGAMEAPLSISGTLDHVSSQEAMTGKVSLDIGNGRLKAERLRAIMNQAKTLIGTILNPQAPQQKGDLLDFESIKGDLTIASGSVRTENLRLKGADLKLGAIGSLRLSNQVLDATAGVHTVMAVSRALGEMPIVKETVKKHGGLLKALGVDKELKRLGIDVNGSKTPGEPAPKVVKTPVTVILKIRGQASSPEAIPVLEAALDKKTAARLKTLME